jgi:hypothetical protein
MGRTWEEWGGIGGCTTGVAFPLRPEEQRAVLTSFLHPALQTYLYSSKHAVNSIVLYMPIDTMGGTYIFIL